MRHELVIALIHIKDKGFPPCGRYRSRGGLGFGVSKTSEKYTTLPAPLESITGMVTLLRMWLISRVIC
jgi:hypothetical protein